MFTPEKRKEKRGMKIELRFHKFKPKDVIHTKIKIIYD